MATPNEADRGDAYTLRPKCLPVYLVVDASSSMRPHEGILNETLAHVHASIRDSPRVAEFAHVSLIVFSTEAYLIIEMANLEDVPQMPQIRCDGVTNYGVVFDLLRSRIDIDVDNLNSLGMAVLRPVVFLLTDGLPSDRAWEGSFRQLADRQWRRHPNVITYGFGEANRDVLSKVTTVVGFIAAPGTDHRQALTEALGSMLGSLVASSERGRVVFNKTVPGYEAVEPAQDLVSVPREYLEGPQPGAGSGGSAGGHSSARSGGSQSDDEEPRRRFLTGIAPERASAGARISLLVQVTLAHAQGASATLKGLRIDPAGTVVTITVSAPGLIPLGDLEQDLAVPFAADSDPVRFWFRAGPVGLHTVRVRAFAGGTCLGDLALEVSVETGAALEEGRPRTVPLPDLAAEPGEVTLQVSRTAGGGYSFQLLSGALYPAVMIDRLAGDPGEVIGQMFGELRALSKSTALYATPALVRRRLRSLGAQLWGDVVPESIREQFWAQRDRIRLFTIASDLDTVPWELLYPVDPGNDDGFLVEQFPVVRRVYGQYRARVLRLDRGAGFIVPPRSPPDALDEVAAVRAAFPAGMTDRGTEAGLAAVLELLDAGAVPSVLHFAGHNTFTDETGSLIRLDGGPLRPGDLSYARQRRAFASAHPLVFLNGCRTAGEIAGFTQMIGWAREFMGAGAGAFIGSLWAVRSAAARTFAAEFYRSLVRDGETLGTASLRARQAIAADEGDPTWLAYTVYGNPAAIIMRDPPPFGGIR